MAVPALFWQASFNELPEGSQTPVYNYLTHLQNNMDHGVGICFHGDPGTGKTSAAVLVGKVARSQGKTVYFGRVWELRTSILSRLQFDGEILISERLREVDVLILDDLAPEDLLAKVWAADEIIKLLTYRKDHQRITVLTTATMDALQEAAPAFYRKLADLMVDVHLEGANRNAEAVEMVDKLTFGLTS